MHTDYFNPIIRQLRDQQVRFAPREKKVEQVDRAEKLLTELEPQRTYPYEYLCYPDHRFPARSRSRISRSRAKTPATICGCSSRILSDAADVPAEAAGEQVLTVEELSKLFNVSTKTISRWRQQGLVSRRFVFDGRKRVGFLEELGRSVRRRRTKSACAAARSSASCRD